VSDHITAFNFACVGASVALLTCLLVHVEEGLELFEDIVETSHVFLLLLASEGIPKYIEFTAHVEASSSLFVVLLLVGGHASGVVDVTLLLVVEGFIRFVNVLKLVSSLFGLVDVRMILLG